MKGSWSVICLVSGLLVAGTWCTSESKMVNPRIIVVGAGAAGVAAVSKLYQSGLTNVTLLEGSHRYGGRIGTTPFGRDGGVVELGAQWCHGEKGNVVYELASAIPGLLTSSIAKNNLTLVRSSGERIEKEVFQQLIALAEEVEESDGREVFEGSFGAFFIQKFWEKLEANTTYRDIDRETAEQFLVYYHNYYRGYNAFDSWYDVAAHETDHFEITEGDQLLAWTGPKGFSTILDILSGNHPGSSASVRVPLKTITVFNQYVTNIEWLGTPNGTVIVSSEDGTRYETDHVILTVSLGVLKANHRTMFTPSIPPVNQNAIEGIHFGAVNKVFLYFDAPIPSQFGNAISLLWFDKDLEALRQSNHAWAEAVSFFYRVDAQPNVISAWLNGVEGRASEQLPDATIQDGLLHLLSIFARGVDFGNVKAILRSNWSSNRLFLGSYSSRSIITERLQTGAKYLATPLADSEGKPLVLFAGEATSEKYYSTVHAAVESGQREAKRLIDLYN
ncbi:spermine oxidase-like isoform X2 [Anopheles darlingi]|uniref:spermine oxidase-like isoform X2 n=1 Tax=Anopheles darlingi TaxID=43151 RepID=UPI0021003FB8|nr:spermine oxidase-like isoform X2 [Anopheles darlingi]